MNLEQLKAKFGDLQNQIDTIKAAADDREGGLTAEDYDKIKALLDEQDSIKAQIKTAERMEANAVTNTPATVADRGVRVVGPAAEASPYRNIGELVQEVVWSSKPGASIMPRLQNHQKRLIFEAAATGANETVPADGGFLVGTDDGGQITEAAYDNNQVISRCDRRTVSGASNSIELLGVDETSRADGSRWGGIRSYWTAEAAAMTASQPTWRRIKLELDKLTVLFYATDELIADAPLLSQEVNRKVAGEFEFQTQEVIINGNGTTRPQGILNSPALVSQAKEAGQAAATIVYENILKMWTRKLGPANRYVWLINSEIFPQLALMNVAVGTGGAPVFLPSGGASGAPYSTLMGLPLIEIEQAAALGTVGDIMLVDLSQYIVAEKGGVQSAMSIHVQFTQNETVIRWVKRIDGQGALSSAITPFKGSATKSPFVALATRS